MSATILSDRIALRTHTMCETIRLSSTILTTIGALLIYVRPAIITSIKILFEPIKISQSVRHFDRKRNNLQFYRQLASVAPIIREIAEESHHFLLASAVSWAQFLWALFLVPSLKFPRESFVAAASRTQSVCVCVCRNGTTWQIVNWFYQKPINNFYEEHENCNENALKWNCLLCIFITFHFIIAINLKVHSHIIQRSTFIQFIWVCKRTPSVWKAKPKKKKGKKPAKPHHTQWAKLNLVDAERETKRKKN